MEEIKRIRKEHLTREDGTAAIAVTEFKWLIQQAELYEATNKQLSPKLAKLNEFIQERHFGDWGHSTVDISMDLILILEEKNQRYKQALEEIIKRECEMGRKGMWAEEIANKALEEPK